VNPPRVNQPVTESITLPVIGMTCASCQHHVESALNSTVGVQSAHVDLMANRANVVFNPASTTPENLVEAIRSAGYDAVLPRTDHDSLHGSVGSAQEGAASRKAWVAIAAGAAAMLLSMPLDVGMGGDAGIGAGSADRGNHGLGRARDLFQCLAGAAPPHDQYEHAGEPGNRRSLRLVGLRNFAPRAEPPRSTSTRYC
jgi:copper chaperone CopZ